MEFVTNITSRASEERPVKIPELPEEEISQWLKDLDRGPMVTYHDTYYVAPHRLHFTFRISDENLVCMSISRDRDEGSNERILQMFDKSKDPQEPT